VNFIKILCSTAPAKVSASMQTVVVAEGLASLLKCDVRGDQPIQVSWKKDSSIIESQKGPLGTESRFAQHQNSVDGNSSVISADLRIDSSEQKDSGLYLCIASNQYGRDQVGINLQVKRKPSANFFLSKLRSFILILML